MSNGLPFLKAKKLGALVVSHRKPDDGAPKPLDHAADDNSAMEAAAEDILRAITSKDATHLALALQAAFDIMDSAEESATPNEEQE